MKQLLLLIFTVFFIGCGPKFVVNKEYVAPQGDGSTACITVCEQERRDCEFTCKGDYETCMNRAGSRANIVYQKALNSYEHAYAVYEEDLYFYKKKRQKHEKQTQFIIRDYEFFTQQCSKHKEPYACKRQDELRKTLHQLKLSLPLRPSPPRSPVFSRILEQEQRGCHNQCGCLIQYDSCFSRCGGKVLFHKECVDGCE